MTKQSAFQQSQLGDVCDVFAGYAWPSKEFNASGIGSPVIRIQNVGTEDSGEIAFWSGKYDDRFLIRKGDLLLSLSGSFRIAEWNGPDALLNQRVAKLTPNNRLDRRWLFRVLEHQIGHIERMGKHALVNNVSLADLRAFEIPLPPLPEQKRIADILDKADAIRRKRKEARDTASEISLSAFQATFKKYLTQNACKSLLGDIAEVVSGITKGRTLGGVKVQEVPYLRVANVQAGYLDLSDIKTIQAKVSEVRELALRHGDVVMTEGGDYDKLGRGALWEHDIADCIHQNHVFRVRTNRRHVLPTFFVYYLQTHLAKDYFLRCAKKTTNLASINMTQLRSLPVPQTPLKLQERFEGELKAIRDILFRQDTALKEANCLFNSLIQRAFLGQL